MHGQVYQQGGRFRAVPDAAPDDTPNPVISDGRPGSAAMIVGCGPNPAVPPLVGGVRALAAVFGTHPDEEEPVDGPVAAAVPRVTADPGAIGVPPGPAFICGMLVLEAPGARRVSPGPTGPELAAGGVGDAVGGTGAAVVLGVVIPGVVPGVVIPGVAPELGAAPVVAPPADPPVPPPAVWASAANEVVVSHAAAIATANDAVRSLPTVISASVAKAGVGRHAYGRMPDDPSRFLPIRASGN
jgi:hypothetical protein